MALAEEYQELMGEAAEDTAMEEAQGSDQPEYADLIAPQEEDGGAEAGSEDTENTEDAGTDPSANEAEKPTLTQRQFDQAFAKRRDGLFKQFSKEHEGELNLAKRLRARYGGMSDEEILQKLDEGEADELSKKTGWDKSESMKRVKARREYENPTVQEEAQTPAKDEHLEMLKQQRDHILKRSGVDVVEFLRDDTYLQEQINSKKMDLNDVYAYVLENREAAKPTKPPISTRRTAAANVGGEMSEKDFEKAEEMLSRGLHVRI